MSTSMHCLATAKIHESGGKGKRNLGPRVTDCEMNYSESDSGSDRNKHNDDPKKRILATRNPISSPPCSLPVFLSFRKISHLLITGRCVEISSLKILVETDGVKKVRKGA